MYKNMAAYFELVIVYEVAGMNSRGKMFLVSLRE